MAEEKKSGGDMTVREAGHKGGQRVHDLVEEGKDKERGETRTPPPKSEKSGR